MILIEVLSKEPGTKMTVVLSFTMVIVKQRNLLCEEYGLAECGEFNALLIPAKI